MISDLETGAGLFLVLLGAALGVAAGYWIAFIVAGVIFLAHGWWVARHGA